MTLAKLSLAKSVSFFKKSESYETSGVHSNSTSQVPLLAATQNTL